MANLGNKPSSFTGLSDAFAKLFVPGTNMWLPAMNIVLWRY